MSLSVFIEHLNKLTSYAKMNDEHFYGFKLSVNVCPSDIREWINGLNSLNSLGLELDQEQ